MYTVNIVTCNLCWSTQGLHNMPFPLKVHVKQYLSSLLLLSSSPPHLRRKSGSPRNRGTVPPPSPLPLKDIPQKALVRWTVDVRGSLVRAVVCHFKPSAMSETVLLPPTARCPSLTVTVGSGLPPPARGGVADHSGLPVDAMTSRVALR